jgi:hypothetical protein
MKITNFSAEPIGRLHSWVPHDLAADQVVFLPDACPGKSPLPTGTAVHTLQPDWRRFAISDCGCGSDDSSLRTDGPFAYRDLEDCLELIKDYVKVVERFAVVGYMGHLG